MSLVVTMYVREGIVMASDSRLTLNRAEKVGKEPVLKLAVGQSDSNYKTFLVPGNIGISTFGAAEIGGVPIAGYIESFAQEKLGSNQLDVEDVARELLTYFRALEPIPDTQFHVSGYQKQNSTNDQQVWHVVVSKNTVTRVNVVGQQGATWGGEADIVARLLQPVAVLDDQGKIKGRLPVNPIPWQFFTLQDAIDFCIFAVRSTIDAIRFMPRAKTVGGPIDVLVIKPDQAFWVQRKQLHGEES